MPTREQLYHIWRAQFRLFGGHAVPQQSHSKEGEGMGLIDERPTDAPVETYSNDSRTGGILGTIVFDKENGELEFTPVADE